MRPPNPRLSNNGSGADLVTVYTLDIAPATAQDEEGNWIRRPTADRTFRAIVTPSFSTTIAADGTMLSATTYQVMLYTTTDPHIYDNNPMEWKGLTLVAQGDSVRAAAGAWAFQAVESGPNPDGSGKPYGAA